MAGSPVLAGPPETLICVVPFVVVELAVEDGGRQNSSKRSASREECMWIYVAEESRDWNVVSTLGDKSAEQVVPCRTVDSK